MWRSIHSLSGLAATVFVVVLSLSGAFLATQPVYDAVTVSGSADDQSLADALRHIHETNPGIVTDHLKRDAAGNLKLTYTLDGKRGEAAFDATGALLPERKEPAAYAWTRQLHRAFLLGDGGRILSAIGAIAMTLLTVTGIALLIRRAGGLRQVFTRMSADDAGGIHAVTGRLALLPLLITALTALYLSAQSFSLLPTVTAAPAYPESVEELEPVQPWDLVGLQEMPLGAVNEVIFPIVEDWFDVWTVRTDGAYVFYDQFTGLELSRDPLPLSVRVMDVIRMLHTGEGAPLWAIVLLLASLTVPAFAVTGAIVWWTGRKRSGGRIRNNAALGRAEALILVGSEGGATWGFAAALHKGLHGAGIPVRTVAMNKLPAKVSAKYVFALTSTYGDGDAPKNADRFLDLLAKCDAAQARYAVLGFGDKSFPQYCAFGAQVSDAMAARFGGQLVDTTSVDRQSAQTFEHWCGLVADAIGKPLDVSYVAPRRRTVPLTLTARETYGEALQAPVAVLRFAGPKLPRHTAGDLVSICPPGSDTARLYSLGSCARRDGFLEICVRRQEGGQCSGWLCGLEIGEQIDATVTRNPRFHMPRKGPVVMIGAGTGIAPFTGMIRNNRRMQPVDLFWGGRHPKSDALYEHDIADWQERGLLHRFVPAWSRVHPSRYVQDMVQAHRDHLIARLKDGATIMVCGGHRMAEAVRNEIDSLAADIGLSAAELKRRNRYLEDVY